MHELLFGVVYLPQITCVEEFTPYWTTDNWTARRTVTDFKILKAAGCTVVRYHLYPAIPGKFEFPGVSPDKFIPILDVAAEIAADLGMMIHLDLLQDENEEGKEAIRSYATRYRGKIASYQIGNERWDIAQDPERLKWLLDVVRMIHEIDPASIVSTDLLVPDWVRIRDEMPELYKELDIGYLHYYPVVDYRGWNDLYLADLIDHITNKTGRKSVSELNDAGINQSGGFDAASQSYDHPFYAGSWARIDKEIWITEISSHGYWRWGNLVNEDKRADDWRKVVDAIADSADSVTRIFHHCCRNKMGWREFGRDQSGMINYDGAPRPTTWAYRDLAINYAPADSPLRVVRCDIDRVEVPYGTDEVEVTVKLTSLTAASVSGSVSLDLPSEITSTEPPVSFSLPPNGVKAWTARLDASRAPWGNNHVFARVEIPQGLVYGWGIVARPKRIVAETAPVVIPELSERVRYVQGIEAVEQFLDAHADDCAIIHGRGLGNEAEMGYRLKIVLQAMRCREIPIRAAIDTKDVLNRPLILIGNPEFNLISRVAEMKLPPDQRVDASNPGPGKGLVNVVPNPFGEMSVEGRNSPQSEAIGYYFGGCPAALYIAGSDDDGLKAAAYDVILRIWGRDEKYR